MIKRQQRFNSDPNFLFALFFPSDVNLGGVSTQEERIWLKWEHRNPLAGACTNETHKTLEATPWSWGWVMSTAKQLINILGGTWRSLERNPSARTGILYNSNKFNTSSVIYDTSRHSLDFQSNFYSIYFTKNIAALSLNTPRIREYNAEFYIRNKIR